MIRKKYVVTLMGVCLLAPMISYASSLLRPMVWGTNIADSGTWANSSSDTTAGYWAFSSTDINKDGIPDEWVTIYFDGNTTNGAATNDYDNDGLNNLQEYQYLTNPIISDTDNDGYDDGTEISKGTDALSSLDVPKSSVILKILPLILEQ